MTASEGMIQRKPHEFYEQEEACKHTNRHVLYSISEVVRPLYAMQILQNTSE